MNLARIINHWENSDCEGHCEGHCELCLYGYSRNCSADIKKDTKALIKEFKKIREERNQLVGLKVLLLRDLEDRDRLLAQRVEEVYPEFMKDYNAMQDELEELYTELDRLDAQIKSLEAVTSDEIESK